MNSLVLAIAMQCCVLANQPTSFEQAYRMAVEFDQPLLIVVGAEWCPACLVLKDQVIPQVEQTGALDNVVYFYVDFDRQQSLARKWMKGNMVPQLIRADWQGDRWEYQRYSGTPSPQGVQQFMECPAAVTADLGFSP